MEKARSRLPFPLLSMKFLSYTPHNCMILDFGRPLITAAYAAYCIANTTVNTLV